MYDDCGQRVIDLLVPSLCECNVKVLRFPELIVRGGIVKGIDLYTRHLYVGCCIKIVHRKVFFERNCAFKALPSNDAERIRGRIAGDQKLAEIDAG